MSLANATPVRDKPTVNEVQITLQNNFDTTLLAKRMILFSFRDLKQGSPFRQWEGRSGIFPAYEDRSHFWFPLLHSLVGQDKPKQAAGQPKPFHPKGSRISTDWTRILLAFCTPWAFLAGGNQKLIKGGLHAPP
jgi:hypothetical protein